jgi:monomeric sarcosine oxidase
VQRVDAVVVGGGIMGASSAWSIARRGRSVATLEQFEPGHTRGSSHGGSRIYRLAYPEPFWIDLAYAARDRWRELERASGARVLHETGSVDHGDPSGVAPIQAALSAAGVDFELLDPREAEARWPGMRFDGATLHQADGGRLLAEVALGAMTDQVERLGGLTRWNTPVRAVEAAPERDRVRVVTDDETYEAGVVIVAAGAWAAPLLEEAVTLPELTVTQESVFHFAPREPLPWPSFIHHAPTARYGLETIGEGVKVAEHHSGAPTTADARDNVVDTASRRKVTSFVETWLPGLDPVPVTEATCLYTNTATEDFILDRVGPFVVVSPCSGHGFKFAPVIGALAASLALDPVAKPLPRFALPATRRKF